MVNNGLKLQLSQQRTAVRVCVGVQRTNDNGEVVRYLPINFDLITTLNEFELSGLRYYCILHDKDGDYIHYHLVLISNINRRIKTWLNTIADAFNCDVNNVQIIDCTDVAFAVQYLIHISQFDKYQYDRKFISTNDDLHHLDELLDSKITYGECLTMKDVIDVVRKCRDIGEVYMSFNPSFLRSNLGIINSLCRAYGKL